MIKQSAFASSIVFFAFSAGVSLAADVPSFFASGQYYAETPEDCVAPGAETDRERPMTLNGEGVSAHEFGCYFVEFKPVKNPFAEAGSEPDTWLATASCGDDSGITRPDIFNISIYEQSLWVTSQNDYLYDLLRQREEGDNDAWGFVNREYVLCQP